MVYKKGGGSLLSTMTLEVLSPTPLYRQLETKIRHMIMGGALQPGMRLPSTRELATDLKISRLTVKNVYERLIAEGFLEPRRGSGTFISELNTERPKSEGQRRHKKRNYKSPQSPQMQHIQRSKSSTRISSVKAFRPGIPAVGLFPKRKWIGAYRKALLASDADILGYGPEGGLPDLRQAIAQHVLENRGIECTSEQVIITAGAQHAFTLFAMTMLKSGDTIWAENPGHIAVRDSMIAQGYDVRAAPIDSEGLNLELAKETLPPFSAAFVTPSHQHPLGITTSLPRRLQLLDYARSVNGWIVEDDYDSEFNYDDRPHPALFALDRYGHVIYVGSFSKAMFPGIRLGYLICPKSHAETFSHGLSLISQNTSSITQRAMAQFFEDGSFNSHIRRMKTTYKRRRDLLREAIYDLAPGTCGVDECHAGMHLILRYSNPDINDTDLARALWDGGIECLPLSIFYFETERPPDGLLLGFACADELEITKKLTKLFEVYHQVASSIAT